MKRSTSILASITLALAAAACGSGGSNPPANPKPDMAGTTTGGDDMTTTSGPDMKMGMTGAPTGAPCATDKDCAGGPAPKQAGVCLTMVKLTNGMMLTWPGGYCTSPCRTNKTDKNTGFNTDCPGGGGACADNGGGNGSCETGCATSDGSKDCRMGYACFVISNDVNVPLGCEPSALSECDPKKAGSCKTLQGVDGGASGMQTCVNTGDGTVGVCEPGCDPFKNSGCDPNDPNMRDQCHASDQTGEGLCQPAAPQGVGPGSPCAGHFYSDCPGGYGCYKAQGANMGTCTKYCNDANAATQCGMGGKCVPFYSGAPVKTSVAGICTK